MVAEYYQAEPSETPNRTIIWDSCSSQVNPTLALNVLLQELSARTMHCDRTYFALEVSYRAPRHSGWGVLVEMQHKELSATLGTEVGSGTSSHVKYLF